MAGHIKTADRGGNAVGKEIMTRTCVLFGVMSRAHPSVRIFFQVIAGQVLATLRSHAGMLVSSNGNRGRLSRGRATAQGRLAAWSRSRLQ
jgi:hypothetical protein